MHVLAVLLYTASILSLASAKCQLYNTIWSSPLQGKVETNNKLCKPQGEGAWTFSMTVGLTAVPVPNGEHGDSGTDGTWSFAI